MSFCDSFFGSKNMDKLDLKEKSLKFLIKLFQQNFMNTA